METWHKPSSGIRFPTTRFLLKCGSVSGGGEDISSSVSGLGTDGRSSISLSIDASISRSDVHMESMIYDESSKSAIAGTCLSSISLSSHSSCVKMNHRHDNTYKINPMGRIILYTDESALKSIMYLLRFFLVLSDDAEGSALGSSARLGDGSFVPKLELFRRSPSMISTLVAELPLEDVMLKNIIKKKTDIYTI